VTVRPQASLLIDAQLAKPLATLPPSVAADPPVSLAERNLQLGRRCGGLGDGAFLDGIQDRADSGLHLRGRGPVPDSTGSGSTTFQPIAHPARPRY
jgi:hypothetical protein